MAKKKTLPELVAHTREVEREANPDVDLVLDGTAVEADWIKARRRNS